MLGPISEVLLSWSKCYVVEVMHYTLACMMMLEDFPEGKGIMLSTVTHTPSFSRRHPLASWVASMLLCFAGDIFSSGLIGEPTLGFLAMCPSNCVLTASLIWYLLHYLPFGVGHKTCNLLPIKLVIVSLREVYRARQIHTGFAYATTKFPGSCFVVGVYSVVLGTGMMHMRVIQRLVCGVWSPLSVEFIKPSLTSKMSFVAVLLLTCKQWLPMIIGEGLFVLTIIFFITIKLLFFLRGVDCLASLERHICYVFFGGLVDDIQTWYETPAEEEEQKEQKQKETTEKKDGKETK